MKHFRIAAALLTLLTAANLSAQIGIGGVANNTIYTGSASFHVTNEVGYAYDARLDGEPVAVGVSVPVTRVDYHQLYVLRTNISTLAVASRLVQFIVRSPERGSTEDGIPPFTPYPPIPSSGAEFAGGTLRVVAPSLFPQDLPIPVIVWVEDANGHALRVNGSVTAAGQNSIKLLRGVGSGFLSTSNEPGAFNYELGVGGLLTSKEITIETNTVWTSVAGALNGVIEWPPNSRIAITSHLLLGSGTTLTIGAGTIVRVGPGVDITNNAAIHINGTRQQPVVFTPVSPTQPWGGFTMRTGEGSVTGTGVIFTGSGAVPNWFGSSGNPGSHRTEQALFFCAGTNVVHLTDSAAIALAGQLGHAVAGGTFDFHHFLMQRTTTGGEFTGASFHVSDSAFIECPDDTADFVDGDNDALYLWSGNHFFTNTLIGFTKDDGVDSGGEGAGVLTYSDCWFESAIHEGNSLSGTNKFANHHRSVFINCGQAIEAGYSASSGNLGPTGSLFDCLVTANLTGARYGDNYNWNYEGFIRVTNSILIHNYRDVWGMDWSSWSYNTARMDVRSNALTSPDIYWPENTVWNPDLDASRLAEFITGDAGSAVGVGFALRTNRLSPSALTNGLPVRLSRFSTNVVSLDYVVESDAGTLTSGALVFQPGETVQVLTLPIANPASHELLSVRLVNPVHAEITGLPQVFSLGTNAVASATVLVPFGSTWRYLDDGSDQGVVWSGPAFADAGWSSGPARLGFNTGTGNSGFATVLGYGGNASNKYRTYYFRSAFEVGSLAAFANLFLEVHRDDGIVAYLNGMEIYRNNVTNGAPLSYLSLCTNAADNGASIQSATVPLTPLVTGTNVIAAEIHQSSITSSDLVFDLQLSANPAPPPALLKWVPLNGQVVVYWADDDYALEEAADPTGPWMDAAGSGNPRSIDCTGAQRFFRLKR